MEIGRKIYFDKSTGDVLISTSEMSGNIRGTTPEEDLMNHPVLQDMSHDGRVGMIQLSYGQYRDQFGSCYGFRVNPETRDIIFNHTPPAPLHPIIISEPIDEEKAAMAELIIELDARLSALEGR